MICPVCNGTGGKSGTYSDCSFCNGAGEVANIPATMRHDAGAVARCLYCNRYTADPAALGPVAARPACLCGQRHCWSGSFPPPGSGAAWCLVRPGQAPPGHVGVTDPPPVPLHGPTTCTERALRWTLTEDEAWASIDDLQRQVLVCPTLAEVQAHAMTEDSAVLVPGTPVWVALAQEHPNRHVYLGLVVTRAGYMEGGAWACTAWVQSHADFPSRLLILGNQDDTEWVVPVQWLWSVTERPEEGETP